MGRMVFEVDMGRMYFGGGYETHGLGYGYGMHVFRKFLNIDYTKICGGCGTHGFLERKVDVRRMDFEGEGLLEWIWNACILTQVDVRRMYFKGPRRGLLGPEMP